MKKSVSPCLELYWQSMSLALPLDYQAIERILPHRYPFLLVDRVTEFELDKRIVGIKNISRNEPLLWDDGRGDMARGIASHPALGARLFVRVRSSRQDL